MIKIAVLSAFLIFSSLLHADISYLQLQQLTASPNELSGVFAQRKYLAAVEIELPSSGEFSYRRDESISWRTLKPIKNELLMTPQSIINVQGDQQLMKLESDSNAAMKVFNEIFFAVLSAKWSKLSAFFTLDGEVVNHSWRAQLLPIDPNVAKVVSRIELEGDTLLRKIILHESDGDRTTIVFSNLQQ